MKSEMKREERDEEMKKNWSEHMSSQISYYLKFPLLGGGGGVSL